MLPEVIMNEVTACFLSSYFILALGKVKEKPVKHFFKRYYCCCRCERHVLKPNMAWSGLCTIIFPGNKIYHSCDVSWVSHNCSWAFFWESSVEVFPVLFSSFTKYHVFLLPTTYTHAHTSSFAVYDLSSVNFNFLNNRTVERIQQLSKFRMECEFLLTLSPGYLAFISVCVRL